MLSYYIEPFIQSFLFVLGIYLQKYLRSIQIYHIKKQLEKFYPKSKYTHDTQFKFKCRIVMMVVFTLFLTIWTYESKCKMKGINVGQCFYVYTLQKGQNNEQGQSIVQNLGQIVYSTVVPVLFAVLANLILFSYHLYERVIVNKDLNWNRLKDTKAIIWAPLLQQILFRACFYRTSQQKVSVFYLTLMFSIAHFHRFIWKNIIGKKEYSIKRSLVQCIFTFVFGLYSFYFLSVFHSILASIVLHCMCNFFGPPSISKSNFIIDKNQENIKFHLAAIVSFSIYLLLICYI